MGHLSSICSVHSMGLMLSVSVVSIFKTNMPGRCSFPTERALSCQQQRDRDGGMQRDAGRDVQWMEYPRHHSRERANTTGWGFA